MKKFIPVLFAVLLIAGCGENKSSEEVRAQNDTLATRQDSLRKEKENLQREIDSLKSLNKEAEKELDENG